MNWKEFFKLHEDCIIYGHEDMVHFTVEQLYQAIKNRLIVESGNKFGIEEKIA